jgi:hypothetical protein
MVLLTNLRHALQRQQRYRATTASSIRICLFHLSDDQRRHLSSRKRRNGSFQLDALPFRVSPQEAYTQFQHWAHKEQGLGPFLNIGGPIGSATISAAYTPFWYFDLNIRFVPPKTDKTVNYYSNNYIPEPFRTAYPSAPNGVIHIPGLASYAGFSYRRLLIDPVHNTTPVFMQKDITPFGNWMLEPLKADAAITGTGEEMIEIFPDPWNATRERSLNVIYEELNEMANEEYSKLSGDKNSNVRVEIERLNARRIYMPTYIVEYKILGIIYRAFISGCDASVSVSGISHKTIFSDSGQQSELLKGATSFLSQKALPLAGPLVQFYGLRPIVAIAQLGFNLLARLAMKLHIVGLFGGLYVTYQKIVRPYFEDKESREKWERQRDHEEQMQSFTYHSFRDYDGSAQRYFTRNRERILRSLGGTEGREKEEGNSWYQQWEEWAREQFEQAQREASRAQQEWQRQQQQGQYQQGQYKQQQQQQQQYKQQQQQAGRQYKQKAKEEEFKWDFDVNDPYAVLGVSRGASKEEVSKAFRRVSRMLRLPISTLHTLTQLVAFISYPDRKC